MAKEIGRIDVTWETRLCEVGGEVGYFHTWEHYSDGSVSRVYAIIEFSDSMRRVDPETIKFVDEQNAILCDWSRHNKGENV